MVLHDYKCLDCGKIYEDILEYKGESKEFCDKCGGRLELLVSESHFHLKGNCWYRDNYQSSKKTQ